MVVTVPAAAAVPAVVVAVVAAAAAAAAVVVAAAVVGQDCSYRCYFVRTTQHCPGLQEASALNGKPGEKQNKKTPKLKKIDIQISKKQK